MALELCLRSSRPLQTPRGVSTQGLQAGAALGFLTPFPHATPPLQPADLSQAAQGPCRSLAPSLGHLAVVGRPCFLLRVPSGVPPGSVLSWRTWRSVSGAPPVRALSEPHTLACACRLLSTLTATGMKHGPALGGSSTTSQPALLPGATPPPPPRPPTIGRQRAPSRRQPQARRGWAGRRRAVTIRHESTFPGLGAAGRVSRSARLSQQRPQPAA